MKLTTKQLKQIIKEELNEEQVEFPLETESECDRLKRLRNAYQSLSEKEPENNYYKHMIGKYEKDAADEGCGWREDLGFEGDPEGEEDFYGSEAGEEELSEMKLTAHQLKQIIKEELQGVLNENAYEDALKSWYKKYSREPRAWRHERQQYLDMLSKQGATENFFTLIMDDPSIFASILKYLEDTQNITQLEEIESRVEQYEDLSQPFSTFAENSTAFSYRKILRELFSLYEQNYMIYDYDSLPNFKEDILTLIGRHYKGSPQKLYIDITEAILVLKGLLSSSDNERVNSFEEFEKIILSGLDFGHGDDDDWGEF